MVADVFTITRAVQSRPWPAQSANLEYAAVWGTCGPVSANVPRVADDIEVRRIGTLLEPAGRAEGNPIRLAENARIAFQGCIVLGMGFVISPAEAKDWIAADPRNAEVLFPYLNGENLNSRPDTSASRWVIDFDDRDEHKAAQYRLPFRRVDDLVKPERLMSNRAARRARWWQFAERAAGMRKAISGLSEVLVIARVSKTVMPMRVPTGQVFHEKIVVFATDSFADLAILSSSPHQLWSIKYGTTMRTDPTYTPDLVFGTLPRVSASWALDEAGITLDTERREIMLRRKLGLTALYNLVNDPGVSNSADPDVARLREIHVEVDRAVLVAYGWSDIDLVHGFHAYRHMTRWTVSPAARVEILDRLLDENQRRAATQ